MNDFNRLSGQEGPLELHSRGALSEAAPAFSASVSIVIAYLGRSTCSCEQVGALLRDVHAAAIEALRQEEQVDPARREAASSVGGIAAAPAVPIEDSVTDDYLICLEDGKKVKSLKPYLRRHCGGMTVDQYRLKWKLPDSYPLVAPALSRKRSLNAKQINFHNSRSVMRSKA